MSVDLKARATQAVELAGEAGAEDAWSTVTQSRDVQFEYRDGNLEKVKDTTSQSLAIQVYADDRYSSHQTTDLNPDRLGGFVSEAVAITRALEPDEHRQVTPEALFANRPADDLDLVDATVATLDRDLARAFKSVLDSPLRGCPVMSICGDWRKRIIDCVRARELIGWEPTPWTDEATE